MKINLRNKMGKEFGGLSSPWRVLRRQVTSKENGMHETSELVFAFDT